MNTHPEIAPALLLETLVLAVRTAGNHANNNRHRKTESIMVAAHDVKLKLDLECQEIIWDIIRTHFPTHAILAEESSDKGQPADDPHQSPYTWIIDPIDGTVNFTHGLPWWCCSVAVNYHGKTVAGAVYAPATNELFTAARGGTACCNGIPIAVSSVTTLKESMVLTGLDQKFTEQDQRLSRFLAISNAVQKARVIGAAALDMCRVAAGQSDGYFEGGIYTWDVAAAGLIVELAGGRVETLAETSPHRLIYMATNGLIHDELKTLIKGLDYT
ncbi:MAG: inositol monophosphatase family protein [bacterium]|jgi:myo-inositol-1(or 4)-monophosphatase